MGQAAQSLVALALLASAFGAAFNLPELENGGQHYAVLVAGSDTYYNYRHQADICHAYQVLLDHGVPAENIITMMVDDIAYNEENPTPGVIINHPNGHDVYKGVKIDYREKDVTPDNFIKVITGDAEGAVGHGTGRVLESGPNDYVFINFADHGAPGLVAFPEEELKARTFISALNTMHSKKLYRQLVIYIEACESGSMFNGLLPDNINIYATTAANGQESSYACYMDRMRHTYLGDVYSVNWMENSDVANLATETLQKQYQIVKQKTNTSHVQEFGYMKMAKEPVSNFQGKQQSARNIYYPKTAYNAVPSDDAKLHILSHKVEITKTDGQRAAAQEALYSEVQYRRSLTDQMFAIARITLGTGHVYDKVTSEHTSDFDFDCYEHLLDEYKMYCQPLHSRTYALRLVYVLQNMCNEGVKMNLVSRAMQKVCA